MTSRALADYLPDFGIRSRSAAEPTVVAQPAPTLAQPPAPDVAGIVATEVALAEARLRAELTQAGDDALAAERDRHAAEMNELRAMLGSEAGGLITARMAEAEARISALATSAAARVLSVHLSDDLARRSVERLTEVVRQACEDREAVRIRIVGPQSLFEGLQAGLGAQLAERCDFAEAPGFDLTVAIDGALFETRLGEWSAAIGEALK